MNSPTCSQCDCVAGCSANLSLCPILVAECIASSQVSAAQHRVIDAPIAQPEQPAPVRQPLTTEEISDVFRESAGYGGDDFQSFARAIEAKINAQGGAE